MTVHYYTSISFSYLSRAVVLLNSVRQHHPDWVSWIFVSDKDPHIAKDDIKAFGFDRVVFIEEIGGDIDQSFIFKHNVVELCTAVKGAAMGMMFDRGADVVVYLDPDVVLFNKLAVVLDALESNSIVLTPHVTIPEGTPSAILDNEIGSLKHGVFNLGFIAVKNDQIGRSFAHWWSSRLKFMCYEEVGAGVYTDQKWCDLVPCFFDNVFILRHPGCNVASWNIGNKRVYFSENGKLKVNNDDLLFYHFTKIQGPGFAMTERYLNGSVAIYELIKWYRIEIEDVRKVLSSTVDWFYGRYSDGMEISFQARQKYRRRKDLQAAFPSPFQSGPKSYQQWFADHGDEF